jgi:heptosyltransferase-2/heptosyltransferase-3
LGSSFDAALILRRDHWWGAWLALAAGIPLRVGYAVPETAPFLSQAIPHRPGGHEAVQNLALVAEFARLAGAPARHDGGIARTPDPISHPLHFRPAAGDAAAAGALLERAGLSGPLVAIHPGSGADVKLWRAEGWAAVAGALARERGARVLLTGSADERELCAAIAAQCASPVVNAAGATTLGGLAALYARCRLVLGPDSGPLHLAVTQGTPTVHLFGPADPVAFGPWGPPERHRVVTPAIGCAPCGVLDWNEPLELHPCVRELPVEAVLAAARAVWPRGA